MRVPVVDAAWAVVDGVSDDPPVLVEAWAHIGPPKAAQKHKLAADALKLLFVERRLFPSGARTVMAMADAEAAAPFVGRTWLAAALRELGVEVLVVPLPAAVRRRIRRAQARQYR